MCTAVLLLAIFQVQRVHPVMNPGKGPQGSRSPSRFWAVYTKLLIFQLTEYRRGKWAWKREKEREGGRKGEND